MEENKLSSISKADSDEKIGDFWDTHDFTDFDGELEEVAEPVFVRGDAIKVRLVGHRS